MWKSRWPSWASVPNKPKVSVDVKQHSTKTQMTRIQRICYILHAITDQDVYLLLCSWSLGNYVFFTLKNTDPQPCNVGKSDTQKQVSAGIFLCQLVVKGVFLECRLPQQRQIHSNHCTTNDEQRQHSVRQLHTAVVNWGAHEPELSKLMLSIKWWPSAQSYIGPVSPRMTSTDSHYSCKSKTLLEILQRATQNHFRNKNWL